MAPAGAGLRASGMDACLERTARPGAPACHGGVPEPLAARPEGLRPAGGPRPPPLPAPLPADKSKAAKAAKAVKKSSFKKVRAARSGGCSPSRRWQRRASGRERRGAAPRAGGCEWSSGHGDSLDRCNSGSQRRARRHCRRMLSSAHRARRCRCPARRRRSPATAWCSTAPRPSSAPGTPSSPASGAGRAGEGSCSSAAGRALAMPCRAGAAGRRRLERRRRRAGWGCGMHRLGWQTKGSAVSDSGCWSERAAAAQQLVGSARADGDHAGAAQTCWQLTGAAPAVVPSCAARRARPAWMSTP